MAETRMRMTHPRSKAVYEREAYDVILVTTVGGKWGRFDRHGRHISGDLKSADMNLCMFVADGFPGATAESFGFGSLPEPLKEVANEH